MAESTAGRRYSFFVWLALFLSQIVLLISLFVGEILDSAINSEVSMMDAVYGQEKTTDYLDIANNITTKYVIDTGALEFTRKLFLPKAYINNDYEVDFEGRYDFFWEKVDEAIDNLVKTINFSLIRVVSMLAWLPLFILLLTGALVSGYLQREIKKEGFEYSSPLRHGIAKKVLFSLPITLYIVLVLPIGVHPLLFPAIIVTVTMFAGWYISNTIKRV